MDARRHVLLVDDDPDFVAMHKSVLEQHGYRVAVAYDSAQCRRQIEVERPDVVVLDIMMATAADGIHLAEELRHDPATRDIPIIVTTAVNLAAVEHLPRFGSHADAVWVESDAFLEKPVWPERLLAEIDKRLKRCVLPPPVVARVRADGGAGQRG